MYILGILSFLIVPFLLGTLVTSLLREKEAGLVEKYATGFVFVCLIMLGCILVSLKLDWSLKRLEILFGGLSGILCIGAITVLLVGLIRKSIRVPSCHLPLRDALWFLVPAVLLGCYSFFAVLPSFLNDDTWEMVETTVSTGTFYEYSALTGFKMEAGLPIYNKILAMPMLLAIVKDVFGVDMWLMGRYIVPILVYVINLILVYRISGIIYATKKMRTRATFMCVYLIFLMAGTYLPSQGLPVTIGYAVLREGYSGYAIAYGIAIPLAILLILRKKYFWSALPICSLLCLLRLDRVFFNLMKYPVTFQASANSAGKLSAIYFAALVVLFFIKKDCLPGRKKAALFVPAVCVSFAVTSLGESFTTRKKRMVFYLGVSFIIFSACTFRPFNDAVPSRSITGTDEELMLCLSQTEDGAIVWGTEDIMSEIRRIDGNVRVLYSRAIYTTEATGLDYEKGIEEYTDISNLLKLNVWYYSDDNLIGVDEDECLEMVRNYGADYLILRKEQVGENFEKWLLSKGFKELIRTENYYMLKDFGA